MAPNLFEITVRSFARAAALTFVRIFLITWYIYFGLQLYANVQGHQLFYWVVFLLSVLGLWRLTELGAKVLWLTGREGKPDEKK